MSQLRYLTLSLFLVLGTISSLFAAAPAQTVNQDVARETLAPVANLNYTLEVVADRPTALYKVGETAVFNVQLKNNGQPVVGEVVSYTLQGEKFMRSSGTLSSALEPVSISVKMERPGFVLCEARITPKDGKPVTGAAGVGAEPLSLKAEMPEPADFDAFWQAQKEELAKTPLKELERVPVNVPDAAMAAKVLQFDVKVSCAGGAPVSGYLTLPRDAKPKSLPAILSYHGAGVDGARPLLVRATQGFIALDINAHGILNGQPKEYYEELNKGALKEYFLQGNKSRDTAYFRGMYLRVLRSLEYIRAQPEWDGKNIIVCGGSQGGAQALVAAGLDPQVTFCAAAAPWLCNLGGVVEGTVPASWPGFVRMKGTEPEDPEIAKTMPYFDPAILIKRTKAECVLTVGFQDRACPPATVYVAYNNIPGKKEIVDCTQDTHKGPNIYNRMNEALARYIEKLKAATPPAGQ